jgi:hypothetical protein
MKYKKVFFAFAFALFFSNVYAQEPAIEADSVLIKLTVTTQQAEKLETVVSFEDLVTHKIQQFKTGKNGQANCKVSTAANFRISIKESNDSYEYNIPDFAISPVILTFKFTIK